MLNRAGDSVVPFSYALPNIAGTAARAEARLAAAAHTGTGACTVVSYFAVRDVDPGTIAGRAAYKASGRHSVVEGRRTGKAESDAATAEDGVYEDGCCRGTVHRRLTQRASTCALAGLWLQLNKRYSVLNDHRTMNTSTPPWRRRLTLQQAHAWLLVFGLLDRQTKARCRQF